MSGAVRSPGLVALPAGSRVVDALAAAGGATSAADQAGVNLAARLVDGQQIVVPKRGAVTRAGEPTARPAARIGAPVSLSTRDRGAARDAAAHRARARRADHRVPGGARRVPLHRRPRAGRRHRPEDPRRAAGPGRAVTRPARPNRPAAAGAQRRGSASLARHRAARRRTRGRGGTALASPASCSRSGPSAAGPGPPCCSPPVRSRCAALLGRGRRRRRAAASRGPAHRTAPCSVDVRVDEVTRDRRQRRRPARSPPVGCCGAPSSGERGHDADVPVLLFADACRRRRCPGGVVRLRAVLHRAAPTDSAAVVGLGRAPASTLVERPPPAQAVAADAAAGAARPHRAAARRRRSAAAGPRGRRHHAGRRRSASRRCRTPP